MIVKKIQNFLYEKKKRSSDAFIQTLSKCPTDFLKEAYIQLDSMRLLGHANEFTEREVRAVEEEMVKRGLEHQNDF